MVTRKDLLPGSQIAQALHAFREFAEEYPVIERAWYEQSNFIAILAAKNEEELLKLCERAEKKGVCYTVFREPDLDNQLTAIALEPGIPSKKLCSSYALALKEFAFKSEVSS